MADPTFTFATVAELSDKLARGDVSSVELTQHFLARIKQYDAPINSFITRCDELALASAQAADERRAAGDASPLTGIPMAHKDIFCTAGVKTSCASRMLDNFIPPYSATVVTRLEQAGSVTLGKVNMDEFAMGSSNETSFYGKVCNPWDLSRVPGGSSGGSAAAVAAGLTPFATGTDTGGSIRQPASLCGITGLKPTYGRVSRLGIIAFASSLDQAGPMTRTAEDAAMVLSAISGVDAGDSTSADYAVPDFRALLNTDIRGLRIGLPKEYFSADLAPAVGDTIYRALAELEAAGAVLVDISLPHTHQGIATYYVIAPAEASANLSRYDGVRFGHRCDNPNDLIDLYERSRSEGFGDEVKRRILVGTYALSAGFYDAYFKKAQQVRRIIANDFKQAFNSVDIIAGPTAPGVAFKHGEKAADPLTLYMEDVYTLSVNLAGLPGMSIPAGFVDGLPLGMQLIGKAFDEQTLLNVGHCFQQRTAWHRTHPTLAELSA